MPTGAVLSNVAETVFNKGYMYGTRKPDGTTSGAGVTDAITFGALQNISIDMDLGYVELTGPESLLPVGVGVGSKTVNGSFEAGVITPEQFTMAIGGLMSYAAGPPAKTTYTELVEGEPQPFDIHFVSAPSNPDFEVFLYNCLCNKWNIVKADNRTWILSNGTFRAYGQSASDGGVLFKVIKPGQLNTAS